MQSQFTAGAREQIEHEAIADFNADGAVTVGLTGWSAFTEACRSTDAEWREWFRRVTETVSPLLGPHRGLGGYRYRVSTNAQVEIVELLHADGSELAEHPTHGKAAFLNFIRDTPLIGLFSRPTPQAVQLSHFRGCQHLTALLPPGALDSRGWISGAFHGEGVNLCWLYDNQVRLGLRQTRDFQLMAAVLAAGFRARQVMALAASALKEHAFVLNPTGTIANCTEPYCARVAQQVIAAVRHRERARTTNQQRSIKADSHFDAFVAGKYALVDNIDLDGKRWVVAVRVRDDDIAANFGGLDDREQQVAESVALGLSNKEIAARLQVSERTVAASLSKCCRHFGVASRAELAHWFRARESR